MPKTIFSENMILARRRKGWSQNGAATAIQEAGAADFTRYKLASYEESRATPRLKTRQAIASVYGIDNFERFMTDPNFFHVEITPQLLQDRYTRLDPITRKAVDVLLGLV